MGKINDVTVRDQLAEEHGSDVMTMMFTPKLRDWWRGATPCGRTFDICWLSANVRAEDGEYWKLFRSWQTVSSSQYYETHISVDRTSTTVQAPDDHYYGMMFYEYNDDKTKIVLNNYSYPGITEGKNFRVELEPGVVRWTENNGRSDLTFTSMGPAWRWICLGGDVHDEILYQVETYDITGTVNGKKVSGYGSMDFVFGNPGETWQQNKIYGYIEDIWVPFVTYYENGNKYYGHFLTGRGGFRLGYYVKNGKALVDNDFEFHDEWNATGTKPVSFRVTMGGHDLEWINSGETFDDPSNRPTIGYSSGVCHIRDEGDTPILYADSAIEYRPYYLWGETSKATVYN